MRRRLHILVACTQRKTRAAAEDACARHLPAGGVSHRVRTWRDRLGSLERGVPAHELYSGEHWRVAETLPDVARGRGFEARLWVVSGGFGLVPRDATLSPYQATLGFGHSDSVASTTEGVQAWWAEVGRWRPFSAEAPRTVSELAAADPDALILVVLSPPYLRALVPDLLAARADAGEDRFVLVGSQAPQPLSHVLVRADARLQALLGGARISLNGRVARRLLESATPDTLGTRWARHTVEALVEGQPELMVYDRRPLSDVEVEAYIRAELAREPGIRRTPLLRRLRAAGRACEQRRFGQIYNRITESIGG